MHDDTAQLRTFVESHDASAFEAIVERHLSLVYSTALRRLAGDTHLAQDVVQLVFSDLARKAAAVHASDRPLAGWLHTSACYAAAKIVRSEQRRRARESKAAHMQADETFTVATMPTPDADRIRPLLDDALARLPPHDREAVLLRYFRDAPFLEIGRRLGTNENTARMRVSRALEKLRLRLASRGLSTTTAALAAAITGEASLAPPSACLGAVVAKSLAASAASTGTLVSTLALVSMNKLPTALATLAACAACVTTGLQVRESRRLASADDRPPREAATVAAADTTHDAPSRTHIMVTTERALVHALEREIAELEARAAHARASVPPRPARIETVRKPSLSAPGAFEISALDQPPRPGTRTPPKYPFDLRSARIPGTVVLGFVVDAQGNVTALEPLDSTHPAFTNAAIEAVSTWSFEPGMKEGRPVPTRVQIPIRFTLTDPVWF
jgi:RNA polymerase sigma factor (sigma-70 family)